MSYTWTDEPLVVGKSEIEYIHISEIHNAVNNERNRRGMGNIPSKSYIKVQKDDINDLRDEIELMEGMVCLADCAGEHNSEYTGDNTSYWQSHENVEDASEHIGAFSGYNDNVESDHCNGRQGQNWSGTYIGNYTSRYPSNWSMQYDSHCPDFNNTHKFNEFGTNYHEHDTGYKNQIT